MDTVVIVGVTGLDEYASFRYTGINLMNRIFHLPINDHCTTFFTILFVMT